MQFRDSAFSSTPELWVNGLMRNMRHSKTWCDENFQVYVMSKNFWKD